jgi:hypothetical protein
MNTKTVIDSWIAEQRLAPRRRRQRQQAEAVAGTQESRIGRNPQRESRPSVPAIRIQASATR